MTSQELLKIGQRIEDTLAEVSLLQKKWPCNALSLASLELKAALATLDSRVGAAVRSEARR